MACSCSGLFNTGINVKKGQKQPSLLVAVHLKDGDGNDNIISQSDITGGLDQTYLDGKINNSDPLARWYPLGEFKDQTSTRDEPVMQEFNDGTSEFVRENPRTFSGKLTNLQSTYLDVINYWRCRDFGIFEIDDCGNINGKKVGADVHPVPVNSGSWHARLMVGNNENVQSIDLNFQTAKLFRDAEYVTLEKSVEVTGDTLGLTGLIQLNATEATAPTTSSLAVALTIGQGKPWAQTKATGLTTLADWTLRNTTTGSDVTISSVSEAPDGTYTLAYSGGVSASDVLKVSYLGEGKVLEPFTLTAVA